MPKAVGTVRRTLPFAQSQGRYGGTIIRMTNGRRQQVLISSGRATAAMPAQVVIASGEQRDLYRVLGHGVD